MNELFLITGASGSGKSTIMNAVMDNSIVSFTTRIPREGEVHGRDYLFITEEEFNSLLDNDGLIEYTEYAGNKYGVTREEYESKLSQGNAYFICDLNGMKQMAKIHEKSTSIYIYADRDDVESNMRERGDSEENIFKRLKTYDDEILHMVHYDFVVENVRGSLDIAIDDVRDIIAGGDLD